MKIKTVVILISIFCLGFIIPVVPKAYSFDDDLAEKKWNTASGKSYVIYKVLEWTPRTGAKSKREPGKLFVISYITEHKLDQKKEILAEYYDLMVHFYHFYLPESFKKKTKEDKARFYVMVESFQQRPKAGEKNIKTLSFTKNLNGVADIASKFKGNDPMRVEALKAFNEQQFKKALSLFEKIKDKVPHDYIHMNKVFLMMAKRDDAKKVIQSGLQAFPKHRSLLHALTTIIILEGTFITDGKYEYDPASMGEARKIISQILEIKKDDYLAYSHLATVEAALKNYAASEKILEDLISKSSYPWQLKKRLGDLYILMGKSKEAEPVYLEALKLNPKSPVLLVALGEFYHKEGKFEDAEKQYTTAISRLEGRNPAQEAGDLNLSEVKKRLKLAKDKKAL